MLDFSIGTTTMNIYTHAVDASHRKAIEALERELFVVLDHSGLQTESGLADAPTRKWRIDLRSRVVFMQVDSKCAHHSGGTRAHVSG